MTIKPSVIQRRFAELGRIRLGHKVGGNGRPAKLSHARFTSPNERYIRDLATLYGGEARAWDNGGMPEWEVFSEASSIPVIVLKGGLSQHMETWSGGGCTHRCDGEVQSKPNPGEACRPNDPLHVAAKPTTRLSVMLPELGAVGSWRLESHGWNAAAELPALADLAAHVGDLVPASINLVERRSLKDGKTSRYVVPVLDLAITPERLREVVAAASGLAELEGPKAPALGGGAPALATPGVDPFDAWFDELDKAVDTDDLSRVWRLMVAERLIGSGVEVTERAAEFVAAWRAKAATAPKPEPKAPEPEPDGDGIVDGVVVEDTQAETRSADQVWAEDVMAAGNAVGMTLPDLEDGFAAWNSDGITTTDATADQLAAYARYLTTT